MWGSSRFSFPQSTQSLCFLYLYTYRPWNGIGRQGFLYQSLTLSSPAVCFLWKHSPSPPPPLRTLHGIAIHPQNCSWTSDPWRVARPSKIGILFCHWVHGPAGSCTPLKDHWAVLGIQSPPSRSLASYTCFRHFVCAAPTTVFILFPLLFPIPHRRAVSWILLFCGQAGLTR